MLCESKHLFVNSTSGLSTLRIKRCTWLWMNFYKWFFGMTESFGIGILFLFQEVQGLNHDTLNEDVSYNEKAINSVASPVNCNWLQHVDWVLSFHDWRVGSSCINLNYSRLKNNVVLSHFSCTRHVVHCCVHLTFSFPGSIHHFNSDSVTQSWNKRKIFLQFSLSSKKLETYQQRLKRQELQEPGMRGWKSSFSFSNYVLICQTLVRLLFIFLEHVRNASKARVHSMYCFLWQMQNYLHLVTEKGNFFKISANCILLNVFLLT